MDSWYFTWPADSTIHFKQKEFYFINKINEWGHREKSIDSFSNSKNVICLGDSFTEGDGVAYENSWVRVVENLSNQNEDSLTKFYNAGVCGSDVFFNAKILEDKLVKLNPKLVIESLNSSDIMDVVSKGGAERFNEDGTTSGKVGPKWEVIYRFSYTFLAVLNVFFSYNNNLLTDEQEKILTSEAIEQIKDRVLKTKKWCDKNDIKYILIVHPVPHEVHDYDIPFVFDTTFDDFDFAYNLTEDLREYFMGVEATEYSWPINGHYNEYGYRVLGEKIFDILNSQSIFINHVCDNM